jgi:hypothetical protein
MLYFKKESMGRPVFEPVSKRAILFESLGGDLGIMALDESQAPNQALVTTLNALVQQRAGGVVQISAEIYDSLKKNVVATASPRPSSSPLLNRMHVSPSIEQFGRPAASPAAAAKPAATSGITIMDEPPPPSSISQFRSAGVRSRPLSPPPEPK